MPIPEVEKIMLESSVGRQIPQTLAALDIASDAGDEITLITTCPRTIKVSVDASAGGTAQTAAIVTIPAGGLIHSIVVNVTETFDGDATTTAEVGVSGNTDKYVDPTDVGTPTDGNQHSMIGGTNNDQKTDEFCEAATAIIATWTNTASATAGAFDVYVTYTPAIS